MIKYDLTIPENVEIKIEQNSIIVKGPLGETTRTFKLGGIKTKQENSTLVLTRENETRKKLVLEFYILIFFLYSYIIICINIS